MFVLFCSMMILGRNGEDSSVEGAKGPSSRLLIKLEYINKMKGDQLRKCAASHYKVKFMLSRRNKITCHDANAVAMGLKLQCGAAALHQPHFCKSREVILRRREALHLHDWSINRFVSPDTLKYLLELVITAVSSTHARGCRREEEPTLNPCIQFGG